MADGRHFENRYIAISRRKKSDFDEILYTAADFELDERHVIKNEKVALDRFRVRQNVFLVWDQISYLRSHVNPVLQTRINGVSKTHNCHGEEAIKLCAPSTIERRHMLSLQDQLKLLQPCFTVLCLTVSSNTSLGEKPTQTASLGMHMLHDMKRIGLRRKLMSTFFSQLHHLSL